LYSSVSTHRKEFLVSQSVEQQKKIDSALDIETADIMHKDFKAAQAFAFVIIYLLFLFNWPVVVGLMLYK
jgi:hypothetical protein